MVLEVKLWFKRVKHAMFCNKPFELLNYCEYTEKGIIGTVRCPQCGEEFIILNKKRKEEGELIYGNQKR